MSFEFKILNHHTLNLHSLLSLEKVLSDELPSEHFIPLSTRIQEASLNTVLGNCPELIESIIESVKQVSQIPTGQYCSIFIIICSHSLTENRQAT